VAITAVVAAVDALPVVTKDENGFTVEASVPGPVAHMVPAKRLDFGVNVTPSGTKGNLALTDHFDDRLEANTKVTSSGVSASAALTTDEGLTLVEVEGAVGADGFLAEAGLLKIKDESDFDELDMDVDMHEYITGKVRKSMTSNFDEYNEDVKKCTNTNMGIADVLHAVLNEMLIRSLGRLSLKELLRLTGTKVYSQVECSLQVSVGAKLKFGMEEDVTVPGGSGSQTFHLFEFGGKLSILGCAGGIGISKDGKLWNGFDQGAIFKGVYSANFFSASISLIVCGNPDSKLSEFLDVLKKTLNRGAST